MLVVIDKASHSLVSHDQETRDIRVPEAARRLGHMIDLEAWCSFDDHTSMVMKTSVHKARLAGPRRPAVETFNCTASNGCLRVLLVTMDLYLLAHDLPPARAEVDQVDVQCCHS